MRGRVVRVCRSLRSFFSESPRPLTVPASQVSFLAELISLRISGPVYRVSVFEERIILCIASPVSVKCPSLMSTFPRAPGPLTAPVNRVSVIAEIVSLRISAPLYLVSVLAELI